MRWHYDDGGRQSAGFKGEAPGDCVVRAISIALDRDYREVYDGITRLLRLEPTRGVSRRPSARTGVPRKVYDRYLFDEGWAWTPTMRIGSGTTVHLAAGELPAGRLVVRVTKHVCAVLDGVIHDTHDPSRGGTRAVYGYYRPNWSDQP
jgi:hypothetical protein